MFGRAFGFFKFFAAIRRKPDRLNCTLEWMICAFKCLGLRYGNLDIRIDDGD